MENSGAKGNRLGVFFRKHLSVKAATALALILLVCVVAIGLGSRLTLKGKATKLGFEDIGELATQSAYCTQVEVIDKPRELFGKEIPFTQSKYIFSYDVVVKAGYDFENITWSEKNKIIEVKLPEAKILSCEIDRDSFEVYHEKESAFSRITLEDNNEAEKDLVQKAEKAAVENGLLENARRNAEALLTGYFANGFDPNEYEIKFCE